jgi:hypothetical protein
MPDFMLDPKAELFSHIVEKFVAVFRCPDPDLLVVTVCTGKVRLIKTLNRNTFDRILTRLIH